VVPVQDDDGWLLGAERGFVYLTPDGTFHTIASVAPAGTRMNDSACDPQGRFWAGTLADDHREAGGALYRLDRTGRTELMLEGLTIANGVGWSPDGRTTGRAIHPCSYVVARVQMRVQLNRLRPCMRPLPRQ